MDSWRRLSRDARATLVSAAIALTVTAVVVTAVVLTPDPTPTIPEAHAMVEESFDRVVATLPSDTILDREIERQQEPCPAPDRGDLIAGSMRVELDASLDRSDWIRALRNALPEEDGWHLSVTTMGAADQFRLRIVGRDLSIVSGRLVATGEGEGSQLALSTTSECTALP